MARKHGDGLYVTLQLPEFMSEYSWVPYLAWGTVLDDGEALDSQHARDAGGPGWAWDAGGHALLTDVTISGTRGEVRRKLADLAGRGVTEIVFQPCGPDVREELERFLDAANAELTPG